MLRSPPLSAASVCEEREGGRGGGLPVLAIRSRSGTGQFEVSYSCQTEHSWARRMSPGGRYWMGVCRLPAWIVISVVAAALSKSFATVLTRRAGGVLNAFRPLPYRMSETREPDNHT